MNTDNKEDKEEGKEKEECPFHPNQGTFKVNGRILFDSETNTYRRQVLVCCKICSKTLRTEWAA